MSNLSLCVCGWGQTYLYNNNNNIGMLQFRNMYYNRDRKKVWYYINPTIDLEILKQFFIKYRESFFQDNNIFYFQYDIEFWEKFFNKKSIIRCNCNYEQICYIKVDKEFFK